LPEELGADELPAAAVLEAGDAVFAPDPHPVRARPNATAAIPVTLATRWYFTTDESSLMATTMTRR
jgi:hypothetical protein